MFYLVGEADLEADLAFEGLALDLGLVFVEILFFHHGCSECVNFYKLL